ncbi:thiopurine S-methyltransferase [Hyphomicrobium denitrificans 1NES1]|uniref:Thiopurine S-methyltransferase n=1 Tax=Hyphomicrobium denitrificans 1NES1 TaxID=670307 RepID=N0BGE4_9HYPH|nr:thiopurine S-methyltransferase [Hyphomicrobium denitrificans]AGK59491.1 thiopurine S-methyltransferase [Hyphomicrobium denitrificans 1NES1]
MDKAFWTERWKRREIGFHQPHIHEQLKRFWPTLGLPVASAVFVPLSGKSCDMIWLATQGHRVIGVELSEVAVQEFFKDGGQTPEVRSEGPFDVFSAGPFNLYRGDFFETPAEILKDIVAVYDRAALVALPPQLRARYAEKLTHIIPQKALIFLVALDYPENEISGPPFSVTRSEVERLYGDTFDIQVLEARDGLEASGNLRRRGVTRLQETAYLLRRR